MSKKLIGYRFKIVNNFSKNVIGSGFMTSSTKLTDEEQKELFHAWTNGRYIKHNLNISINIFESEN